MTPKIKAVANAQVPVTANINIKVPVDLKLQLGGILELLYLLFISDYLIRELKKNNGILIFFQIKQLFVFHQCCIYKQIG